MQLKAFGLGLIAGLILTVSAMGQAPAPAPDPTTALPSNIYAFGATYNPNGSPVISGTGLYGRLVDTKGTYAITGIDVVPTTTAPYTVTTNPFAGVAQQFYNNGTWKIFVTPAAGLSYSGTNTGYSYAIGGLLIHDLSPNYAIGFGGRLFKSNISNSGYQPAVSVEFILKQQ